MLNLFLLLFIVFLQKNKENIQIRLTIYLTGQESTRGIYLQGLSSILYCLTVNWVDFSL